MRVPTAAGRWRRLQRVRFRLLVQGFGASSEAVERTAKPSDHAVATAARLPSGSLRAGCQEITGAGWLIDRKTRPTRFLHAYRVSTSFENAIISAIVAP